MADIFDKITGGLTKAVAVVGANSKAMVEKAKVNTAIKNLEGEQKQLAELLGMKIYDIFVSGKEITGEDVSGFAEEITKRLQLIAGQNERLKQIEAEVSMVAGGNIPCSSPCKCNHMNPQGAKFCAKCGNPL